MMGRLAALFPFWVMRRAAALKGLYLSRSGEVGPWVTLDCTAAHPMALRIGFA